MRMSEPVLQGEFDPDVTFVTNMKAYREAQGIGRGRFAQLMSERGHSWHESTVPKVEAGTRSVKIGEALAVAQILKTTVTELLEPTDDSKLLGTLTAQLVKMRLGRENLLRGIAQYETARREARDLLPTIADKTHLIASLRRKHSDELDRLDRTASEIVDAIYIDDPDDFGVIYGSGDAEA